MEFESLLRSTLRAEAASLPVAIGPADVLRRRDMRRRRQERSRLRVLLVAALVVLPLGLVLAAGVLRLDPSPAYSAVVIRASDDPVIQVLVARDGAAQRVLDVPVSRFGDVIPQPLEASASGWIALYAVDVPEATTHTEYLVLFDVRDAHPPIVRVGTGWGAWTPDGRYWSLTNGAYELIDPVSGRVTRIPRGAAGDLDWWSAGRRVMVEADGAGLLVGDSSNAVHDGPRRPPQKWGVLSPEGILSRGLPELADGMGPRTISPQSGLLQICGTGTEGYRCPGLRPGAIVSGPASDGSYRQWGGDPPTHDHIVDASWAADGGLWLLVDRRSGDRTMVLVHRDVENIDREVAAFAVDVDEDVTIGDLAPDDSLIGLELSGNWPAVKTVIVDTKTGRSHLFDGALGGFVPAAATVDWLTEDAATEAGQLLAQPAAGGDSTVDYGPLPSVEEQLNWLFPERVLLEHEEEATSSDPGRTMQLTLGPVELDEGIGISLACSGPGEITLTEIGPDGPGSPETYRCLHPSRTHGGEKPNVTRESATVHVQYDSSTTWRLIVYDPQPREPRP